MKENIKSENLGLTPTKNYAWRKWASNALTAQIRRRGHNCGLTIDGLIAITPSHCPCCKKILVPQGSVKNSPTVDRIDTTKGYELNNIWVICFQCNQTKGQHRFPDILYKIADAWYFKLKEKVKKLCK